MAVISFTLVIIPKNPSFSASFAIALWLSVHCVSSFMVRYFLYDRLVINFFDSGFFEDNLVFILSSTSSLAFRSLSALVFDHVIIQRSSPRVVSITASSGVFHVKPSRL